MQLIKSIFAVSIRFSNRRNKPARRCAADAENAFKDDHRHQQFPRAGFDFRADDFGVEEIFELVDDNEEHQRGECDIKRCAEAQNNDDGVGNQVARHRNQAGR